MKEKPSKFLETHRVTYGPRAGDKRFGNNGMFVIRYNGTDLGMMVSDQCGWDHVSVSTPSRCPTWEEMEYVRSLWFRDDEWVVQYSAPRDKHINNHPYVLHMWRPHDVEIPVPPREFV